MALFQIIPKKRAIIESRFSQLHNLLKASFGKVKRDTSLIFQWLNYFNQKIISQDQTMHEQNHTIDLQKQHIEDLKKELSMLPKKEDIKRIIDENYATENLMNRLNEMEKRLSMAAVAPQQSPSPETFEIQQRLEKLEKKKANLKEKLIKKITRNSKDYVKSIITSLIKKYEEISALQLKEMIVDEQGVCSKSSFCRLLQEIEETGEVGVIKKGKEKHYIGKIMKQNT